MKVDYLIGLRSGDIGDYAPPSERLYSQVFNETGLETSVSVQYKPRTSNEVLLDNEQQMSSFPFDYRSSGPFYGVRSSRKNIVGYSSIFSSSIGG